MTLVQAIEQDAPIRRPHFAEGSFILPATCGVQTVYIWNDDGTERGFTKADILADDWIQVNEGI